MTVDNTPEIEETQEESALDEATGLVRDLRNQIKALNRELQSQPKRSELEAEFRAAVARERAIEAELGRLNLPVGLSELIEAKLGEREVTAEAVAEVLTAVGFQVTAGTEGGAAPEEAGNPLADQLSGVANLGSQVAQVASGISPDNLTDKINAAETPAELAAIMAEAGLGQ